MSSILGAAFALILTAPPAAEVESAAAASPATTPPPARVAAPPLTRMDRRYLREQAVMKDPALHSEYLRAQGLGRAGVVVGSLGLAAAMVVSLPLWLRYRAAVQDANDQVFRVQLQQPLREIERRRQGFRTSLVVAGGLTVLGSTLAIVGYRKRSRILRSVDTTRLSWSPVAAAGHYGASGTLRF